MSTPSRRARTRRPYKTGAAVLFTMALTVSGMVAVPSAHAIATAVNLGTAGEYVVLGGQTVTNTGPSVLGGSLGVSPGTEATGFPPNSVAGETNLANAAALQAKADLDLAYDDAAGQPTAPDGDLPAELGGLTLVEGVYTAASAAGLTGTLTLDAQGNADAVWVFQIGSGLTTASSSVVSIINGNGANACNVFWQVAESATLGSDSDFVGTLMALTSISIQSGATVEGRALARNGSVTLINNVFTAEGCGTDTTSGPTDPSNPTNPIEPSEPEEPGEPTEPETPGTPVTGGTPGTPLAPSGPTAPGVTPPTGTRGSSGITNNRTGTRELAATGADASTIWLIPAAGFMALGGMLLLKRGARRRV